MKLFMGKFTSSKKKKKKKIDGVNWRTDFANKVLDSKERYIDIVAYIIEILSDIFRS